MYHSPLDRRDIIKVTYVIRAKQPTVDVEVLLDEVRDNQLIIRTDEKSRRFSIPRQGVRISNVRDGYATLTLTERSAINNNLI